MKRVVSSSILSVIVLLLVAGAFFYFQIKRNVNTSVFKVIPADVAWIISVNPASGDLQRLARTSFFNGSDSIRVLNQWQSFLLRLDSLCVNDPVLSPAFEKSSLIISGHVTGPSSYDLMFFIPPGSGISDKLEKVFLKFFPVTEGLRSRNYNGVEIKEVNGISGKPISWAVAGGVFIVSTASFLVEDAIRMQKQESSTAAAVRLEEMLKQHPNGFLLAFRYAGLAKWTKTQLKNQSAIDLNELEQVGDWAYLQLELHANQIAFSGETFYSDSSSFISNFRNQQPVQHKLIEWLPAKTAAAIIWGVSDPGLFFKNRSMQLNNAVQGPDMRTIYKEYFSNWIGNEIALLVTQPALHLSDNNFIALVSVQDSLKCQQSLTALSGKTAGSAELYNGCTIRYIEKKSLMEGLFGTLFKRVNRFYYTAINQHIVIGNQASVLRAYINDVKTGNLLKNEDRYKSLAVHVPLKSNVFFYAGFPQAVKLFNSYASPSWNTWLSENGDILSNWSGLTYSISNEKDVFKTSGCLGYFNEGVSAPQLLWNAKLDTTIASGPFMPAGIKGLILVVDALQQLYAFDNSGELKWKKKLETPVLSDVEVVDYYNNGGHHYLLNTHSFIYLFDSLGNNTGNYPFRLPAEASTGLTWIKSSLADNSRILIPCKNLRLYTYSVTGKPMQGFNPVKLPGVIIRPVFNSKDGKGLILLEETGVCFVLNDKGERLFTVKGKIDLREQDNFIENTVTSSLLAYVSQEGKLFEVDSSGKVDQNVLVTDTISNAACTDLNGDKEGDWIFSTKHTLFSKTRDGLTLFRYTTEELIDRIGLHTVDRKQGIFLLSGGKVFLLNRDGTLAEGFPLPGIDLPVQSIDESDDHYFLIKEGNDNFCLYFLP